MEKVDIKIIRNENLSCIHEHKRTLLYNYLLYHYNYVITLWSNISFSLPKYVMAVMQFTNNNNYKNSKNYLYVAFFLNYNIKATYLWLWAYSTDLSIQSLPVQKNLCTFVLVPFRLMSHCFSQRFVAFNLLPKQLKCFINKYLIRNIIYKTRENAPMGQNWD